MQKSLEVGGEKIILDRPVVMGILNVTADSFYDGGKYTSELKLVERVHQIVEEGAAIIDVGACSTRPGATLVEEKEELLRLTYAVERIRRYFPRLPVSIDTFRANVAREINHCLGATIINDISGGTLDPSMFETVARLDVPYVLTHIQGVPCDMQDTPCYENVVAEVREFFVERVARLRALGFDKIILDQGFGFGKSMAHNYELMNRMDSFLELSYPLLVGISRKTMIWKYLGITPDEALNGTTVLNTIALMKGASILRVHDVKEAVEAISLQWRVESGELKIEN